MSPPPETRLAFWSLAYLVALNRGESPVDAALTADASLDQFDYTTEELNDAHQNPT